MSSLYRSITKIIKIFEYNPQLRSKPTYPENPQQHNVPQVNSTLETPEAGLKTTFGQHISILKKYCTSELNIQSPLR